MCSNSNSNNHNNNSSSNNNNNNNNLGEREVREIEKIKTQEGPMMQMKIIAWHQLTGAQPVPKQQTPAE